LLLGDADYATARETLQTTDWNKLSPPQAAAGKRELMQRQLWGVKRLVHELLTDGEAAGKRRLELLERYLPAGGASKQPRKAERPEIAALTAALFNDPTFLRALSAARAEWFPELDAEIRRFDDAMPPPASASAEPAEAGGEPSSGWYLTVSDGMLRYRVTGHTDRLLRALLDLSGRVPHPVADSAAQQARSSFGAERIPHVAADLFRLAGDPTATFRCLGCHTPDRADDGRLTINWEGRRVSPGAQSFTKFSHAPHVTLLVQRGETNDCSHCHAPHGKIRFVHDAFINVRDGYSANTNPHASHTSGFLPVEKHTCAECHTSQLAGDNCLKCHNYHVFE
jgi:hypothetical protein